MGAKQPQSHIEHIHMPTFQEGSMHEASCGWRLASWHDYLSNECRTVHVGILPRAALVKFRHEEDLQLLTGTRQSGGERSVSTILYLIALQ
eukprot:scaffold182442_cov19-Tisochrysis_lutea.AAC.1